jgi:hypothetical protein
MPNRLERLLVIASTVLTLSAAGATAQQRPPDAAPGAAPSTERLVGTWTVTEFRGGPSDGRGDHSASTTYRFQDGGRVTVAGSRQCAYTLDDANLKVDCAGRITSGTVEFRGDQGMAWTIGTEKVVIFVKR